MLLLQQKCSKSFSTGKYGAEMIHIPYLHCRTNALITIEMDGQMILTQSQRCCIITLLPKHERGPQPGPGSLKS